MEAEEEKHRMAMETERLRLIAEV